MDSSADWMGDVLPEPADRDVAGSPAWAAFRSQFSSYSQGARTNRIAYQTARAVALVLAAAVTVSAGVSAPPLLTAGLGAAIVVLEGLQQLFQWHVNWIAYRQAAESMRQHAIDVATGVGAYASPDPTARVATLSRARRELAVAENRSWASRMSTEPDEP
jgi:hypothetical protein